MIVRNLLAMGAFAATIIASSSQGFSQSARGPNWFCKHVVQSKTPPDGEFSLRIYPFGTTTASIDKTGAGLLRSIETTDLLAIQAESLRRKINRLDPDDEREKHLYLRESAPNTIVYARGRRVVVFPRVFLLHPRFANILLQQGDFVATVCLQNPDAAKTDPVFEHLRNNIGYSLKGPHQDKVSVLFINQFRSTSKPIEIHPKKNGKVGVKQFLQDNFIPTKEEKLSLGSLFIVHAIRRQHNGLDYLLLYPDGICGAMGMNGVFFRSLFQQNFEDDGDWEDAWYKAFDEHNFQLVDGDQVQTTTFELLDLF